jgi:hypothetical protein
MTELPENLGDSLREACQPGGGAGDEHSGLAGHVEKGKWSGLQ